ncbi:MAG: dTDP-4-dehydrorhamnose reductase [Cellulomonas sp.]|nr:dTDP-4-dehydrorhamnose reductase [Cellulomonas sp.]
MLGRDMAGILTGEDVTAVGRDDVDITDLDSVRRAVRAADVVVNCAAYTAVDQAETEEAEAFAVNAVGPANLARVASEVGARLVQISTDYVFAGDASSPYGEDDPIAPRTAYGRTKAAGEWAVRSYCADHLIVRTAWLYGAGGTSFPSTIARLLRERGSALVIDDQVGQPTWTVDLAGLIVRLVEAGAPSGIYHGTSSGGVSWYGFARAIASAAGVDADAVGPTTSAQFVRPAARPAYSVLGHDRLREVGVEAIGPWDERWARASSTLLGR